MNNIAFLENLLAKTKMPNGPVMEGGPPAISTDVMPRRYGPPPPLPQIGGPQQPVGLPPIQTLGGYEPDLYGQNLNINRFTGMEGQPPAAAPVTPPVDYESMAFSQPTAPTPTQEVGGLPPITRSPAVQQLDVLDDAHRYDKPIYETTVDGKTERTSDRKKYEQWKAEGRDIKTVQEAGVNRNKKWSWWEKLGAGALGWLTGGLAGGIKAATDRNYFEKIGDARQREMLMPQIARQQAIALNAAKTGKEQALAQEAFRKGQREDVKAAAGIQNQAQLRAQAALKEALGLKYYKKDDPRHRAVLQRAGINPDSVPEFDDRNFVERRLEDGTSIKISGSDAWKEEQANMRGDIARTQDITKFNANNQLEVQKKNADNEMKYQDDVRAILTKTAEANAGKLAGNATLQSVNSRMLAANAAVQAAAQAGNQKAFDKASKEFDDAVKDYGSAMGKVEGGAGLAAELQKAMPKRPPKITYEPVRAATVGVGTYTKAQFIAAAARRGLAGKALEAAVAQAARDGVIK